MWDYNYWCSEYQLLPFECLLNAFAISNFFLF